LQLGRRLADHGALATAGDVFWLPLSMLRALERGEPGASDLRAQVARARAAWEAARADPPPAPAAETVRVARGSGTAGRVLGRVCLLRPGEMRPIPADAVVVAQTLLPTELPLIDAAALVTEVGGALDHVAAQARERGLPAVVGAAGACSILADGDLALVDADHGVVVRLG
jgi:pyruvate,water dikinase